MQKCLNDIKTAHEMGYPPEMEWKLHFRAAKCNARLGNADELEDSIQELLVAVSTSNLGKGKGKPHIRNMYMKFLPHLILL